MTLLELSAEYREIGEKCRLRLAEQRALLASCALSDAEHALAARRVTLLTAIVRESIATSIYLRNYYGRNAS